MHNSYIYKVTHIHNLVGHVSQIFLQAANPRDLRYVAGQYVNIIHHDLSVSPLSIACAPNLKEELEFHLFHPPLHHPAQDLLRMANQEGVWNIAGPFGHCTDKRMHNHKPTIFIARGTGFAPIKAVVEALSLSSYRQPMHFYWSMPSGGDFYLRAVLEHWSVSIPGFNCTLVHSDKNAASPNALCELMVRDHADFSSCQVFASGSPSFVQVVYESLQPHGLQREFFYSDVFE